MTPAPLDDALVQARAAWLAGERDAWTRYAVCVAQLRALDAARRPLPPGPRPPRAQA